MPYRVSYIWTPTELLPECQAANQKPWEQLLIGCLTFRLKFEGAQNIGNPVGMFMVHATIPRSSFKDIQLEIQIGYKDLLEQAMTKASPEIKLVIAECKACPSYCLW
jgi:hypothetical protein